jgi:hypothetical protein
MAPKYALPNPVLERSVQARSIRRTESFGPLPRHPGHNISDGSEGAAPPGGLAVKRLTVKD